MLSVLPVEHFIVRKQYMGQKFLLSPLVPRCRHLLRAAELQMVGFGSGFPDKLAQGRRIPVAK